MASEYASSPVAQPATQTRSGASRGSRSQQLGQDLLLEHREGLLVAEEAGHADEQIAIEHVELVAIALQRARRTPRCRCDCASASRRSMRRVTVLGL